MREVCLSLSVMFVEYALQNISSPIGVSEFNVKELLPENLKSKLPTVEEVEEELNKLVEN